jgi:osmotically-inducible protein OsmY
MSRSDAQIHKDVVDELAFEPSVDGSRIAVAVADGIVTLSGSVPNFFEKWRAEGAVKRVSGVQGVAEELTVSLFSGMEQSETEIASAAVRALEWDSVIPQGRVEVNVENGWITLTGKLEWQYQSQRAFDAVAHLRGVKGVTNLIAVTPIVSPTDVRAKIVAALERSAELDAARVHIDVSAGSVTLRGKLSTWGERDAATRAAWNAKGVTGVTNEIIVGD